MMKSSIELVKELHEVTIQQHLKIDALIEAISRQENSEQIFELAYSLFYQYKGGDDQ